MLDEWCRGNEGECRQMWGDAYKKRFKETMPAFSVG